MYSRFTESPNARSKTITSAELDTFGMLNCHSTNHPTYHVGVSENRGKRKAMEDSHSFVVDFDSIRGQGVFAVFDGHAGKHAAEWCGSHFHEYLLDALHAAPTRRIPDVLNDTFHKVDEALSRMCDESDGKIHSGCTAVTAFLRVEDVNGHQSFVPPPSTDVPSAAGYGDARAHGPHESNGDFDVPMGADLQEKTPNGRPLSGSRIHNVLKSLSGGSISRISSPSTSTLPSSDVTARNVPAESIPVITPPDTARRVLYSANVGDARGVLCRAGKAVRLTYDHKGSDRQEAKRIMDAGGFVLSGRVNGVLAVTRSLGDSSMKEFVVGAPYTTETELCDEDEFLILACDGLWDIIVDQAAVDLIKNIDEAQAASAALLAHALSRRTMDNVTVLVVRFKHTTPATAVE